MRRPATVGSHRGEVMTTKRYNAAASETVPPCLLAHTARFDARLREISAKVLQAERLSESEAFALAECDDLFLLGFLANAIREKKNGHNTYYNINVHLNPSNVCIHQCLFCAFSRKEGEPGAYDLSLEAILEKLRTQVTERTTELHIVGGVHPRHSLRFYRTMLATIKAAYPRLFLKAFTAVEVEHMAALEGCTVEDALKELQGAGLSSMPGGGAEVFSPRLRQALCPTKISGERWLEIHETAHRLGIKTNATMLYGHIETAAERVNHLLRLRSLQDRTGGFQAFVPLPYHAENTRLGGYNTTGCLDGKIHALSRILLDNFDHIKAFWIMTGTETAQVLQSFGVDDLDGTVTEEKITHAAGASTPLRLDVDCIRHLISSAGRVPVERDTLYHEIA